MPEGLVPRMAIEWGFLILLAVGAAVADIRPAYIILVMAIGWILVVLVELLAWRAKPSYVVTEATAGGAESAPSPRPAVTLPPVIEPEPARAAPGYDFVFDRPGAEAPPPDAQTAVVPPAEKAPLAADDPYAPAPEREYLASGDQRAIYSLEPLLPRPTRKYRWFGPFLPREGKTADEGT